MTERKLGAHVAGLVFLSLLLAGGMQAQAYRGFAPGASYREFAEQARRLAVNDPLVCNTPRRTAQLMECGVLIRDPTDSATFYLSAYVIEGRVAHLSFGDSGGPAIVERTRRDLERRFGPGRRTGISTIEWGDGRKVVRFNWRGRGNARWIYILLDDRDVMDRIARYRTR